MSLHDTNPRQPAQPKRIALVIANPDRAPKGRPGVRVRAIRHSFNYDNQEGDGLQTGISTFAGELWKQAGVTPGDVDVASVYDDYPTMVLAQWHGTLVSSLD